jgi:hypothetical protein
MPSTISIALKARKLAQTWGSVRNSIIVARWGCFEVVADRS